MRVAVIGTGIAGLSAAWALRRVGHDVLLLERQSRIGMDAHTVMLDPADPSLAVDIPMRTFTPGLWRNLVALCAELGVETRELDLSASYSELDGRTFFRHQNLVLRGMTLPAFLHPRHLTRQALHILHGLAKLKFGSARDLERGGVGDLTLREYLEGKGYPARFVNDFLFPMLGTICTCSNESIARYPAALILQTLQRLMSATPMRRFVGGTRAIVDRLAADLPSRCGVAIRTVHAGPAGARVRYADGAEELFDHVVIATQANHARTLLGDDAQAEREVLGAFEYETASVVVHTDARLMPRDRAHWSPLNFFVPAGRTASMSTAWVNRIEPALGGHRDVFQTWNPLLDPEPSRELARVSLQRPVVNHRSLQALRRLAELQGQPGRRVWFCGSYAAQGVPLLESAVLSSMRVATALGAPCPWGMA